eukprot:4858011-Pyramimonas_sp.AAC.1
MPHPPTNPSPSIGIYLMRGYAEYLHCVHRVGVHECAHNGRYNQLHPSTKAPLTSGGQSHNSTGQGLFNGTTASLNAGLLVTQTGCCQVGNVFPG